jgi:hypothetical protein
MTMKKEKKWEAGQGFYLDGILYGENMTDATVDEQNHIIGQQNETIESLQEELRQWNRGALSRRIIVEQIVDLLKIITRE